MTEPQTNPLVPFPLLAEPATYEPCLWDLSQHPERRDYWLSLFRRHFTSLLEEFRAEADQRKVDAEVIERAATDAEDRFFAHLDLVTQAPGALGRLTILRICDAREKALRAAGIDDPYRLAKQRDTDHALSILPRLLRELDQMLEADRRFAIMQGIFAGNIYDLGATETVERFTKERVDFHAVRDQLKPRPWRFDDLDAWLTRWQERPHHAAVLFVDNAGPDVTLGMIPFARELVRSGTKVILTANTYPSLNDVTFHELEDLIARVAAFDSVIADAVRQEQLLMVPSGNHAPLIDLSRVSPELAAVVTHHHVDLVVLEGMGRAVESNFDAAFSCDVLKLAMIKDLGVADGLADFGAKAELYDLVMRYEQAAS